MILLPFNIVRRILGLWWSELHGIYMMRRSSMMDIPMATWASHTILFGVGLAKIHLYMMLYNNIEHNKIFYSSSDTITQICVINSSTAFYTGSSVLDSILVYHHLNSYDEPSSFDRASEPFQNIKIEPAISVREEPERVPNLQANEAGSALP